jgi:hypothetical protein
MAAAAACRRWGQLETKLGITGFRGSASTSICDPLSASLASVFPYRQLHCRQISQLVQSNGKRLFLVDTLALVISLLFLNLFLFLILGAINLCLLAEKMHWGVNGNDIKLYGFVALHFGNMKKSIRDCFLCCIYLVLQKNNA